MTRAAEPAPSFARARRWLTTTAATPAGARLRAWAGPVSVFLLALYLRASFVEDHPLDWYLVSNMEFIDARAKHLLAGATTATDTFTPVGYPALVALAGALSGKSYGIVGAVQAVLGAATAVLGGALAARLTRSRWIGWGVGLALALYLPLIVYTGFLLTETLFAFLVTLLAHLLARALEAPSVRRDAIAGVVFGAATAVRPNLILVVPPLVLYALWLRRGRDVRWKSPLRALAFGVPILALVAAHNTAVLGRPAGLATNGGVNFLLGHCECRGISFPPGTGVGFVSGHQNRARFDDVLASPRSALDEGYYYRRTLELLRERPSLVLRAALNVTDGFVVTGVGEPPSTPYYPGWMGHEEELRAFGHGFAWLVAVPTLLFGIALAMQRRAPSIAPEHVILGALFASVVLTLYLYLGDPRLRLPFDPLFFAAAADGWTRTIRRARATFQRAR